MDRRDGRYVYCVLKGRIKKNFGRIGLGKRKNRVYTIPYKNVSAVVSDVPVQEFNPEVVKINLVRYRQLDSDWLGNVLFTHRGILNSLFKRHTVIPVPFFTVPRGEDEVKKLLKSNYEKLRKDMERLQNMQEMRVRIAFDRFALEDSIKEEFSARNREFHELDSVSRKTCGGKSMLLRSMIRNDIKIEARKRINKWAETNTPKIRNGFKALSRDVKLNMFLDDKCMISMSFLVRKRDSAKFAREFRNVKKQFDSKNIKLALKGPFPVYNFASQKGFAA